MPAARMGYLRRWLRVRGCLFRMAMERGRRSGKRRRPVLGAALLSDCCALTFVQMGPPCQHS